LQNYDLLYTANVQPFVP